MCFGEIDSFFSLRDRLINFCNRKKNKQNELNENINKFLTEFKENNEIGFLKLCLASSKYDEKRSYGRNIYNIFNLLNTDLQKAIFRYYNLPFVNTNFSEQRLYKYFKSHYYRFIKIDSKMILSYFKNNFDKLLDVYKNRNIGFKYYEYLGMCRDCFDCCNYENEAMRLIGSPITLYIGNCEYNDENELNKILIITALCNYLLSTISHQNDDGISFTERKIETGEDLFLLTVYNTITIIGGGMTENE